MDGLRIEIGFKKAEVFMKKNRLLSVFAMACVFFLASCTEESSTDLRVGTFFADYATFSESRAAWVEPESYSFVYRFSYGDSSVYYPISVTVKDGESTVDLGENHEEHIENNSFLGNTVFENMTQIYDYFEDWYQKRLKDENDSYNVTFSAQYGTNGGMTYPTALDERRTKVRGREYDDGYGGLYIRVTDFAVGE